MKAALRFLIVLLVTISIEKGLELYFKPENKLTPTEKLQELLRTKRELAPINMHDQECEEEGVVEEGDNLKSYFLCEKTGKTPALLYKEHKCEKGDFFNASTSDCSKLPGGGHIDCVTHTSCPEEFTGITQFPNSTMQRNYVICLENIVIVAECEELWYFSNETKKCQPEPFKRKTVLVESNCKEIKEIQCENADVIEVVDEKIAETCSNCYYFCVEAENDTFALTIYCFGNVTTEEEDSSGELSTLFTQLEGTTKSYSEIVTSSAKTTLKDQTGEMDFTSTVLTSTPEPKISSKFETTILQTEKSTELTEASTQQKVTEKSLTESIMLFTKTQNFTLPEGKTETTTLPVEKTSFSTPEKVKSTTQIEMSTTELTEKSTELTEASTEQKVREKSSTEYTISFTKTISENKTETTTFPEEKSTTQTEISTNKVDEKISPTPPVIIPPLIPETTTEQQLVEKSTSEPAQSTQTAENVKFTSAKPPAETATTSPELSTTINISFSETTQSIFPTSTTKERPTSVPIFHTETKIIEQPTISTTSPEKPPLTEMDENFTSIKPATEASSESQTTTPPPPNFPETFPSFTNITETTIKSIASSSPAETTPIIATATSQTTETSSEKPKPARHPHCLDKGPPCTSAGYFRLNHSCTQHYECFFSQLCNKLVSSRIYNCPKCLKFNEAKMCCDLPENVPECSNMYRETPHTLASRKITKKSTCTGPGTFFAPDDCEKYYSCSSNKSNKFIDLVVKKCPKGSRFNRNTLQCEKGLQCRRSLPKCKNGLDYYISDKFDCNKFYHCLGKMFVPLTCPAGTIFDGKKCDSKSTTYLCDWEALKKKLHKHKKI